MILPCLNEEAAVADTVAAFRASLPNADIVVFDNGSTDRTMDIARRALAIVREEPRRGKGSVVRRAFANVEADVYVLADGDGTYDAAAASAMVDQLLRRGLDMVTGVRTHDDPASYPRGHVWGNQVFSSIVATLFDGPVGDVFSGYRVLSRRFVKSFPSMSDGFEIEAEMSIHALQLRMPIDEHQMFYRKRQAGSSSKLRTFRDGARILKYVIRLARLYRPRQFFGSIGALFAGTAFVLGIPLLITYLQTGLVPRFPTAILATGMVLLGALMWLLGVVLESTSQIVLEMKRLRYLAVPGPDTTVGSSIAPRALADDESFDGSPLPPHDKLPRC